MPCNCPQCKNIQSPFFYPFDRLRKFIADQQYQIQCQASYKMVNVLSLIDDVVDLKKLIPEDQQNRHQPISINGNIEQLNFISRDVQELIRKIRIDTGNYNEHIERDYIDQSRQVNISDHATVNSTGAGAFNLGEISGEVANTINQLPNFDQEPEKQELKTLLIQLNNAVLAANLEQSETEEALEQIQTIIEALQDSQNTRLKRKAKSAMVIIKDIASALPPDAALVTICNQLPDLISKIF